ncbi:MULTISPECIES: hypothetical protein [Streptomyces]|uniref:hypothetical protein n=1 Tax=Streptomyces TaxID=1883 RepID=UPI002559F024|nr:hypothetical protein [Streptomyces hilarionis]
MPLTADQPQVFDVRSAARRPARDAWTAPVAPGPVVAVVAGVPRPREAPRPARRATPPRPAAAPRRAGSDVLRVLSDPRTPVFVTEHAGGRRVYGYWRPLDAEGGRGGCYVALSAAECDELYAAGRITLGEPVTDPAKTTYRVLLARTKAAAARPAPAPVAPAGPRRRAARAA